MNNSDLHFIAFHPEDDDVCFLVNNDVDNNENGIYKYHIKRDIYKKVQNFVDKWPGDCIQAFTLIHPWLPTKIPQFPPIQN